MPQVRAKRKTSRGIIIHEGAVLLIERWRTTESGQKLHYFSIPGGKIEPGETPEVTVVRELYEETSLIIRPRKLVANQHLKNGKTNTYFVCDYLSGSPALHPSAAEMQLPTNRSKPTWVKLEKLVGIKLNESYEPLRTLIEAAAKSDLPENPLNIK